MRSRILIVDDDVALGELLVDGLAERGFDARACATASHALQAVDAGAFDALVTDLRMPSVDGLALLERAKASRRDLPVIVMTAFSGVESAVECIRRGAYHYLTKPFRVDELVLFLERALGEARLRRESHSLKQELRGSLGALLGDTAALRTVRDLVLRVADADVPVLVLGETGTGKGLVARALHGASLRADAPFVSVNCAALPEALLESELFGHAKGAFTGASSAREGLFSAAHGGTLFLDEIAEMSVAVQAKLLHVLETSAIRPLGENRERKVDVRVVAATHRDLRQRVQAGEFREDLLYRLEVVPIELPALRHRREDIPLLLEHFFAHYRERHPHAIARRCTPAAHDRLVAYDWPGNVRELAHTVERLLLLTRDAEIQLGDLPPAVRAERPNPGPDFGESVRPMREMQRMYASWALERCGGEKRATCEALEIDYKTLMRYVSK